MCFVCRVLRRAFWDDAERLPPSVINKEYIAPLPTSFQPMVPVHFINYNRLFGKPCLCGTVYGRATVEVEVGVVVTLLLPASLSLPIPHHPLTSL